jgi:hypothetical protein
MSRRASLASLSWKSLRTRAPAENSSSRPSRRELAISLLLLSVVLITAVRVVSTYSVLAQAQDEPAHIACGMEWIQRGTYTLEPLHPPLARVSAALGPYLDHLRLGDVKILSDDQGISNDIFGAGNEILAQKNHYIGNLALARLGVLPYLVLGILVVFWWARLHYGRPAALISATLFALTPPVLAFGGLAYTDLPVATMCGAALLAFVSWLERPTWSRSVLLGLCTALAVLAKFTALIFLPPAALGIWILYRMTKPPRAEKQGFTHRQRIAMETAAVVIGLLVVWGGYRFSFAHFNDVFAAPVLVLEKTYHLPHWAANGLSRMVAANPIIPAPTLLKGFTSDLNKNTHAPLAYLFGHIRRGGWWYFFLVELMVKTPLPILLLFFAGTVSTLRSLTIRRKPLALAPLVSVLAMLLVVMPVNLNYGVRHILPIYLPLSIVAGVGAWQLWQLNGPMQPVIRGLMVILMAWLLFTTTRAHPDYLSYFNELADGQPEKILAWGCDLDCGEDLLNLARTLHERNVQHVTLALQTSADLTRLNLPKFELLEPHRPTTGWIVVSKRLLQTGDTKFESRDFDQNSETAYSWLRAYRPTAFIGRTLQLYYIPISGKN